MAGLSGISIVYNCITVSLMKEENRPYVFVDFTLDEINDSVVNIIVSNFGKGAAYKVKINIEAPNNEKDIIDEGALFFEISKAPLFENIIEYIAPNKEYRINYGRWPIINEYLPLQYRFSIEYYDRFQKEYKESIILEPKQLKGSHYKK